MRPDPFQLKIHRHVFPILVVSVVVSSSAHAPLADDRPGGASRIHRDAIVIDTHIDTTHALMLPDWTFGERHLPPGSHGGRQQGFTHVDLPRMRAGGLDGAFFSIYMPGTITGPEAVKRALERIDAVHRMVDRHRDDVAFCSTAEAVRAAHKAKKIAVLMGMEGGYMIDNSLPVLREYARLGIRYLTLTHMVNTDWADSSGDKPRHGGLTDFGREVVRELNRLGVMVDVSHVADDTFWDALEESQAPLLLSHSSARALCSHPRNITDEMIKALAAKGGVIQINYVDIFLDQAKHAELQRRQAAKRGADPQKSPGEKLPPLPEVSWERIVEHIDHVVKLVGVRHVGLGSDFDGGPMPKGMEDCSQLPKITQALVARGYSESDLKLILGGNLLNLMERVEQVSRKIAMGGVSPISRRSLDTPPKEGAP
jgi:membrane dipeptidase